jgi:hypothetical protein
MCEPTTIGYGIAAIAGGLYANKQIKKAQAAANAAGDVPVAATPPAPTPVAPPRATAPVQASRTAPVQAAKSATSTPAAKNQNAIATMLTGAGGVDLSSLNIGKNTLLGG